jgi:4-amino-4-deoxy-L-arabinose transferase-like glycosyltransferase
MTGSLIKKLAKIKPEYYLLAAVLLFALFLRIYSLGNAPFWIDESISAIASKNIIEKGVARLDSGFYYGGAYLFQYPQAFFMMIFGLNEFAARLVSVIFGLLTIVLAYFIGKEYSKSGGVIAALFFAVFYLEVFFSRQARHYQLFQLLFFLTIYLLYKSKKKPRLIYAALLSLILTIDTQPAGWILVPLVIYHFIKHKAFNNKFFKQKNAFKYIFLIIIGAILVYKLVEIILYANSFSYSLAWKYAVSYASYFLNMKYMVILFLAGSVWAFFRKKELTLYVLVPSITLLIGVIFVKFFAFRYVYFFIFPVLLYSALLFSFFYDKYKGIIIIPIIILILVPSNLFFPYTYVNVITPVMYNLNDVSAPEIDYKSMPTEIISELKDEQNKVVVFFSAEFEWYVRKPDYVLPFSMTRVGDDSVSWNGVDKYSGALISNYTLAKPFFLVADDFSMNNLVPAQIELLRQMIGNCTETYKGKDYEIFSCK